MGEEVTRGLPADLASVLRDQSACGTGCVSVEMITAWAMAPTPTASAEVSVSMDTTLVDALYRQSRMASSTTVAVG